MIHFDKLFASAVLSDSMRNKSLKSPVFAIELDFKPFFDDGGNRVTEIRLC